MHLFVMEVLEGLNGVVKTLWALNTQGSIQRSLDVLLCHGLQHFSFKLLHYLVYSNLFKWKY